MLRHLFLAMSLLAIGGCGSAPKCATLDGQGISDANGSKAQFRRLLTKVTQSTVTSAVVLDRDGAAGAVTMASAIEAAVSRHQAECDRNVVASWNMLSSGEIRRVREAISSRDEATYLRFANRVGEEARMRNQPLLMKAGSEVMAAAFEHKAVTH